MRCLRFLSILSLLFLHAGSAAPAQQPPPEGGDRQASPAQELLAITFAEGQTVRVRFISTERLPGALGEAKVERKRGMTEIEAEFEYVKPALLFGGDYTTYVLWMVSPEGIAYNGGALFLRDGKAKLTATAPLVTCGMFVSAEPHFLVSRPSSFVVLASTSVSGGRSSSQPMTFRGFETNYRHSRESLVDAEEIRGEFRVDRQQAQIALDLAGRAGAPRYAAEEWARAQEALQRTIEAIGDPQRVTVLANEAVRLAAEAQRLAEERSQQAALDAERSARQEQIALLEESARRAKQQIEELGKAKREADAAVEQARRDKAEADKAVRAARQEAARAEAMTREAREESERLAQLKEQAESVATQAQHEREEAHARMQGALSRVLETRQSARGFIVNLPEILFESGQAVLQGPAREVLSRVAGILLVTPDYRLSIEGHTDSVGSEDFNQNLSVARAQAVYSYLAETGVPQEYMSTVGYGQTSPIASNDTAEGRRQNRRVEIVIQEVASQQEQTQGAAAGR